MPTASAPVARTPLCTWHAAHGAVFAEEGGWHVPWSYADREQEAAAARQSAGLADLSMWTKVSLIGPGVASTARRLDGDNSGAGLACRLTRDHLLLLAASPAGIESLENILDVEDDVLRIDATSAHACFGLCGPHVEDVLRQLTSLDISAAAFAPGRCAETGVAGVQALLVRRPDAALPRIYLLVGWDVGEYVWERLLDAGRPWGLTPIGIDAWRALTPGL
jgi:glycine cleavage system aminomethyltransferase T